MEEAEIQPWLFRVEPLQGESLSHFLGRFRRANNLTPTGLGNMAGLGSAIARWEKFRFNPPPSRQQLEALAVVVQVEGDRLIQMLPPAGVGMKLERIRLCGACYGESPCHKADINPFILPSLPLLERRNLPQCSAVYFVLEGDRIQQLQQKLKKLKDQGVISESEFEAKKQSILQEL